MLFPICHLTDARYDNHMFKYGLGGLFHRTKNNVGVAKLTPSPMPRNWQTLKKYLLTKPGFL